MRAWATGCCCCLLAVLATAEPATWSGHLTLVKEAALPAAPAEERAVNDTCIEEWRAELTDLRRRLPAASLPERVVLLEDIVAFERAIVETRLRTGGNVRLDEETFELTAVPLASEALAGSVAVMTVTRSTGSARIDRAAGNVVWLDRFGQERRIDRLDEPPKPLADFEVSEPLLGFATRLTRLRLRNQPVKIFWTPQLPNVYAVRLPVDLPPDTLEYQLARLPGCPLQVEWKVPEEQAAYRIRVIEVEEEK